ncbi:MAG: ribosome maturation factor RimM [Firmicutes bacterium]|nr:ribosome maturation factor RimM [Bacillota bacterium]
MEQFIVVGEIVKPQGLSGEVKIRPLTNDVSRFKKLRAVYVDTALCSVSTVRVDNGFVFIKFADADSREKAEKLVGKLVKVERLHALSVEEGEYFIAELIGCKFTTDDAGLNGIITNVWQHGAADVIEVELIHGGTLMFPFLKSLALKVDTAEKQVKVSSEALKKVAVID